MDKKYFIAFCAMDREHLRSNPFFHSCLLLIEANIDKSDEIVTPLHVIDSYGFYSHTPPENISLFSDPFSYIVQKAGFNFRLRGSYGEWHHETIADLSLGKGLTGKLFEIDSHQMKTAIELIEGKIAEQQKLVSLFSTIDEREEEYQNMISNEMILMMQAKSDDTYYTNDGLYKAAQMRVPISKFNYSITSNAHTCKIAAIDVIRNVSNMENSEIAKQIKALETNSVTNTMPRFTNGLHEIIIDTYSSRWITKGKEIKYPYLSWDDAKKDDQFSMIIADFRGEYVGANGTVKKIRALPPKVIDLIHDLKFIGRLMQVLYSEDAGFKNYAKKIHAHIYSLSQISRYNQRQLNVYQAKLLIETILEDKNLSKIIANKIPANFKLSWEHMSEKYTSESSNSDESDYAYRRRIC